MSDRAELVARFRTFPAALAAAAGRAGPPPDAADWTAGEITRHLIAAELVVWQARLRQVASEDGPHWPWVEPRFDDGPADRPLDVLLATFARERSTTLAVVDALDEAGWARTGVHATYGHLDVEGLLARAIDHDAEHLAGVHGSDRD